jgi:hypothetical protein
MSEVDSSETGGTEPLAHHEVLAVALLQLGGDREFVHTEHLAVRANEIAPGRFTWVHYRDQINIHNIKTCLWKSKADPQGGLFLGSDNEGWMLTERGSELARDVEKRIPRARATRTRPSPRERHWLSGERNRLLSSDAYRSFARGGEGSVSAAELENFFRLNDYVSPDAREKKITRLVNAFRNDPQLGEIVQKLAHRLRGA